MEAAPLWRYTAMVQTYDHMHAWTLHHCGVTSRLCRYTTTGMHGSCATVALHHCGVTPRLCRHTTTGMHGSCATVALHRYGAGIRPQACTKAAPLWRYAVVVQK